MHHGHRRACLLATGVALILAGNGAAFAQTVPATPGTTDAAEANAIPAAVSQGLQDIVVTAQRRSERLQNVPIAVTAISGDALSSKGLASTIDIAMATPGLTYTEVAGSSSPRIRGVGTVTALAGNENSVATYVDGVYYASSYSQLLSLNNIEQVAVLKGPQGTLFGRNATGGLIQITTLDPKQEFGGKLSGTYGNKDTIGGSLYVTGGLAEHVAADLAVTYDDQRDGFGHNLITGQDVNRSKNLTIRGKLKFDIGDETTIKLSGDYDELQSTNPARRTIYGTLPSNRTPFTGGAFDVSSDIQPYLKDTQGGGSVNLVHHFGAFDVVSLTAYRQDKTDVIFDADATSAHLIDVNNVYKSHQFTQELQLISTTSGPFVWTAGAYYFNGKGGYDHTLLNLPPQLQTFRSYQHTKSPAAYAQGTYKLTSKTSLTLGIRYSEESRRLNSAGQILVKATGVTTPTVPIEGHFSVGRPTWRVALDHKLTPDILVYASYNRGFKSGGFNAATFFPAPEVFQPEKLDAYEIGTKADLLDRHLRVNASAFYYDYSNIQLTSFVAGLVKITNAATAKIYGLDADVTAKPVDRLTLTAGFSYIHDRFGTYPNAQIGVPLAAGGNLISSGPATGHRLPYTPDWTINLGANYVAPLGEGDLQIAADYFHNDGWFAEPDNRLRQNPYDLLNASLTWHMRTGGGLSLMLWGKNLTNQVYAVTLQTQNTSDVFVAAAGRTFGATVGYKF